MVIKRPLLTISALRKASAEHIKKKKNLYVNPRVTVNSRIALLFVRSLIAEYLEVNLFLIRHKQEILALFTNTSLAIRMALINYPMKFYKRKNKLVIISK